MIYSFIFIPIIVNAQITIGSIDTPVQGVLLQLKESEGLVNATKGLGLPRVYLTDMSNIGVDISDVSSGEEILHTGLIVFNTNKCLFGGYGIGIYVWDGISWQYLGDRETSSSDVLIDQD